MRVVAAVLVVLIVVLVLVVIVVVVLDFRSFRRLSRLGLLVLVASSWLVGRHRLIPRREISVEEELAGYTVSLLVLGFLSLVVVAVNAYALIFPHSIQKPAQLAGKSVGVLVGSSEDYELRGWLALEHLTSSVKVVGFASEQAAAAAYLGGSVTAAYVQPGQEAQLIAKLGQPMS